jgi:hypothetical protein
MTWRRLAVAFALIAAAACGDDGVEHPDANGKGSTEYCARAPAEEQNCMACSSKPGCGFCAAPSGDAPVCQPGVPDDDAPPTCSEKLTISSADCPPPPPPVD